QAMALLGCSSLPLFLAAIYLLNCSLGPQPSWSPPVLVPPGRPIPSPKAAVDHVGVAAPSPRNPVLGGARAGFFTFFGDAGPPVPQPGHGPGGPGTRSLVGRGPRALHFKRSGFSQARGGREPLG